MQGGRPSVIENLAHLQNLVKRDADAYVDEFRQQHQNFEAELEVFKLNPSGDSSNFRELVSFLAHVSACYPKDLQAFPEQLMQLLRSHGDTLHPEVRRCLVQALSLLRTRNLIDPTPVLKLYFELFRIQDKHFREQLYSQIIQDVKTVNRKGNNVKVNRALQAFMYSMVTDENAIAARKSLDVIMHLYKHRVWTDDRTVNVIASCCLSKSQKVMVTAIKFFLNEDEEGGDSDDSDDEGEEEEKKGGGSGGKKKAEMLHRHSKKTRKRVKEIEKARKATKKKTKAKDVPFPAIQLIFDPQGLADRLFQKMRSTQLRFPVRLLIMNFSSRLIGQHQLLVPSFYSYIQRYLTSHQMEVTSILAYLIQATHQLVPPDCLLPVVKTICNNFVTDANGSEAIQVGINSVRELFVRCPPVLSEEGMEPLVRDLVMYRKYKGDKGVNMTARGLMNTVRELHPKLLRRKDRGRGNDGEHITPQEYGVERQSYVEKGLQLLQEAGLLGGDGEDAWDPEKAQGSARAALERLVGKTAAGQRIRRSRKRDRGAMSSGSGAAVAEKKEEEEEEEEGEGEDSGSEVEEENEGELKFIDGEEEEEDSEDEDEDEEEEKEDEEEKGEDENEEESKDTKSDDFLLLDVEEEERQRTNDSGSAKRRRVTPEVARAAAAAKSQEKKEAAKAEEEEEDTSVPLLARRVLTQKDFALLDAIGRRMAEGDAARNNKRTKGETMEALAAAAEAALAADSDDEDDMEGQEGDVPFNPEDLESSKTLKLRRRKQREAEQVHAKIAALEGVDRAGRTNADKARKKNFVMVKHSSAVRQKLKASLKQQQRSVQKHLKKMKNLPQKLRKRLGKRKR